MQLDEDTIEIVALAAAGTAAVAMLLALALWFKLHRMTRAYSILQGGGGHDLVTLVNRHGETVEKLSGEIDRLRDRGKATDVGIAGSLCQFAVVRYDAFPDMGGRLSFSIALLDGGGDGLVLTSINGRSEARTYAKGVTGAHGDQQLSPEEQQAISDATQTTRIAAR